MLPLRVLIVDDNQGFGEQVVQAFASAGLAASWVPRAVDALPLLGFLDDRQGVQGIGLVIVDLVRAASGGRQLAVQLAAQRSEPRFGHSQPIACMALVPVLGSHPELPTGVEIVVKPIFPGQVVPTARRLLGLDVGPTASGRPLASRPAPSGAPAMGSPLSADHTLPVTLDMLEDPDLLVEDAGSSGPVQPLPGLAQLARSMMHGALPEAAAAPGVDSSGMAGARARTYRQFPALSQTTTQLAVPRIDMAPPDRSIAESTDEPTQVRGRVPTLPSPLVPLDPFNTTVPVLTAPASVLMEQLLPRASALPAPPPSVPVPRAGAAATPDRDEPSDLRTMPFARSMHWPEMDSAGEAPPPASLVPSDAVVADDPAEDAIAGRVELFSVAELLSSLSRQGQTGALRVCPQGAPPQHVLILYLDKGLLVHAHSSMGSALRLGHFVAQTAALSPAVIDDCLMRRSGDEPALRMGQRLLAAGLIDAADLTAALSQQATEILCAAVLVAQGTFSFRAGVAPPALAGTPDATRGLDAPLQLSVDALLLVAQRRKADDALAVQAQRQRASFVSLVGAQATLGRLGLSETESALLSVCDGRRTVDDLAAACEIDRAEAARILSRLLTLRLCRKRLPAVAA